MKIDFNLLTGVLLCFCLLSCEEENILIETSNTAVIEGYLFAGESMQPIKVSESIPYNQTDSTVTTLDNLSISLTNGTNIYELLATGNGTYEHPDIEIIAGQDYRLEFEWEERLISAETYVPLKKDIALSNYEVELEQIEAGTFGGFGTQIDPVEITWDNSEGDYYYVVIKNIEDDPEYVNENILLFEEENGGRQRFNFISEPNIIDFYLIDPRRELTQFGTYEIIVFRVNPEYAALYESSGNTTQSLEEAPTNIENGLGIFTGVSSDTVYLEVRKL